MFTVVGGSLASSLACLPVPCSLKELTRITGLACPWETADLHRIIGACAAFVGSLQALRASLLRHQTQDP